MTPEQVEAACEAAVARYRARAGAIPDPPAREEIPPRQPVVLPPAAGRYCPSAVCYCRGCAWYVPLPPYSAAHVEGSKDHRRKTGRRPAPRSGRRAA